MIQPAAILNLAIAAGAIASWGCRSAASTEVDDLVFDDSGVIPIVHESHSGFSDPARHVIRNQRDWAFAWSRAFGGSPPARPNVDFSREMVIVAALGARPSSGYDISIDRAAVANAAIEVEVTSTTPGADCALLTVITTPVTMARVPASYGPIRFIEHERIHQCEESWE